MALPLSSSLEALLFAAGEPLTKKRAAGYLNATSEGVAEAIADLRVLLEGRGLALIETTEEIELRTSPEAAGLVQALREGELSRDLGKASLETLAIILYRGGVTRGDIDWVRGVNSSAALRSLLMRGLIERGEDPSDKRRAFYVPTVDALAHLGVSTLSELPRYEELHAAISQHGATPITV